MHLRSDSAEFHGIGMVSSNWVLERTAAEATNLSLIESVKYVTNVIISQVIFHLIMFNNML